MKSKLSDLCNYVKEKIPVADIDKYHYVSTENMIPDKGGITTAAALPTTENTQAFQKGDILVSNIRPYFKKIWLAEYKGGCSNDVLVFRAKASINIEYLYYVLADDAFFAYATQTSKGTKMPRGDKLAIMEYPVPSVDLELQRKIGSILRAIDDKISLNQKINDNLEQQAQALLYNFMETHSYTLTPLGDLADVIDCLHSKKPAAVDNSPYQLLQLNNITDSGFLDLSAKYRISQDEYENWTRKCEIVAGDCVITNVGRIGAVSQAPIDTHAAMGRNMTCVRMKRENPFPAYLITVLLSKHIKTEIQKNTDEGTVMGALNVKNIPKLRFPVFSESDMQQLESILKPIRQIVEYQYVSNQKLSALRDSLLPKLMSGEIDVSELQI